MNVSVKLLANEDLKAALSLALEVFYEFEAPDYTRLGIETFERFVDYEEFIKYFGLGIFNVLGAYEKGELIGMAAIRENRHISLFFVKKGRQRKGAGRLIFYEAVNRKLLDMNNKVTVNASVHAVDFYRKLGFYVITDEQVVDGIRFVPMRYR